MVASEAGRQAGRERQGGKGQRAKKGPHQRYCTVCAVGSQVPNSEPVPSCLSTTHDVRSVCFEAVLPWLVGWGPCVGSSCPPTVQPLRAMTGCRSTCNTAELASLGPSGGSSSSRGPLGQGKGTPRSCGEGPSIACCTVVGGRGRNMQCMHARSDCSLLDINSGGGWLGRFGWDGRDT